MKNFMDENFLLQTETAQKLYHEHAAKMPIIDYHVPVRILQIGKSLRSGPKLYLILSVIRCTTGLILN